MIERLSAEHIQQNTHSTVVKVVMVKMVIFDFGNTVICSLYI